MMHSSRLRRWLYPILLITILSGWFLYMSATDGWTLFQNFWPMSLTMVIGSFVAGSTPQGGAAVAFPVYTKLLHIPSDQARTFGLMIQSFGMTMASVIIFSRRVPVLPGVVRWASFGGLAGLIAGTFFLRIPDPYPKIFFTLVAGCFGLALIIARWRLNLQPRKELPDWHNGYRVLFWTVGVAGGAFASITNSGIDMLTFIVLTLAFGIDEKVSVPTTVIIMAVISIGGFLIHGAVLQDIGETWNLWLVCVPVVIMGAPLGSFAASRVDRDYIIIGLLSLISLELVSTFLLVPFDRTALLVAGGTAVASLLWFGIMLRYRFEQLERLEADRPAGSLVPVPIQSSDVEPS